MTLSASQELIDVLDALAARRNDNRSAIVEMLLREHPLVRAQVDQARRPSGLRAGRSIEKVLALAAVSRQARERAEREGRIVFHHDA